MIPDPIIALCSLVGLFAYTGIGAVVATLNAHYACRWQHDNRGWYALSAGGSRRSGDYQTPFVFSVLLWPGIAAFWTVCGVGFGLGIGPIKIAKAITTYTASALEKNK